MIRIIVNYVYNINVFIDYTNMISIFYYYFMALFTVVINEINSQFQFPIYGSNKMCLGSDNLVKDNYVKYNTDTPINLFHNGTSSKANKNFNIPKSYDNTSFYVRSKGFTQNPQSYKDGFSNKSINNEGYLNNYVSKTNKNLSNHQRPVINNLTTNKEFSSSSLESNYTNDTNHAIVSYTDINKPHLDANLNGYRKDADLRLLQPMTKLVM